MEFSRVSGECYDLFRAMVSQEQDRRPYAEACLRHPWFEQMSEHINQKIILNNIE